MAALGASQQKDYELRERVGWIFIGSVILLALFALVLSYRFVVPTVNQYYTVVGYLDDFPPSPNPYLFRTDSSIVYVANIDGELMVFSPRTPATTRCLFRWQEGNRRFEDPCSGSKFTLDGLYIEGPSVRGLDMHPVHVSNEQKIIIRFDSVMLGWPASPSAAPECVRAVQEADLIAGTGCGEFGLLPEKHAVPYPEQLRRHFRPASIADRSEWYSRPVGSEPYYCTPPLIKC